MINLHFSDDCTGCMACVDACPQQCISFSEDRDGFIIPSIQKETCVNCGLCERICPLVNHRVEAYDHRKCYIAYHKNEQIRNAGSSGSVFYALAEVVIQNGGAVYGAAFDNTLQLHHMRATSMNDVRLQMKSKYIQSDTTGIYKQALADLRDGRSVLFVGTPCQCQALHNMTPARLRENLLLVDIICHGVPSQKLFNMSIERFERNNDCKVSFFSFREKTRQSLRNYKIDYTTPDGHAVSRIGELDDFPFCVGYFNHYTIRNSCYACKQRGVDRAADITLGDFWGIQEIQPHISDFEKGYTSLIVNSERGNCFLQQITSCVIGEIQGGVHFITEHNRAYTKPDENSLMHQVFFWCMQRFGYEFCEKHFLTVSPPFSSRLIIALIVRLDRIHKLFA